MSRVILTSFICEFLTKAKMDFGIIDFIDEIDLYYVTEYRDDEIPRVRINSFEKYNDATFKKKYRFSKAFAAKILDLVKNDLPNDARGSTVDPEIQVACSLRCWARHQLVAHCKEAEICNHTWIPICGQNQMDLDHRLFLDECDLHEYNCDNSQYYIKVDVKVCSHRCTRNHDLNITTPIDQIITQQVTTASLTTPSQTTPTTTLTSPSTTVSTISSTLPICETPTTPSTTPTTPECIIETTTEITTVSTTTEQEVTPTTEEVTEKTTETEPEMITTISTQETATEEPTIETEAPTTTEEITTKTEETQSTIKVENKTCPPDGCFVPSTWETTQKAETRDFYQILKERFGDKVKLLRDTTHFPNPVGVHDNRRMGRFGQTNYNRYNRLNEIMLSKLNGTHRLKNQ